MFFIIMLLNILYGKISVLEKIKTYWVLPLPLNDLRVTLTTLRIA